MTPGYVQKETDPAVRAIIKDNLTHEASGKLTICEQLRFTYDTVEKLPDSPEKALIIEQLIDAFGMGKAIVSRLSYYKEEYEDHTGGHGHTLLKLDKLKERKEMRSTR